MENNVISEYKDSPIPVGAFSYDGYQVVRREFFAHLHEPSITFNNCKLSFNKACLKQLPEIDYIQILINQAEKKLVIRPSKEHEKDSFLWCTIKNDEKRSKQVTCRIFFAKIIHLMNWNPDYRYKILGKLIQSNYEALFIFDLNAAETYQRIYKSGDKIQPSRNAIFPAEWQNQFGVPVEEHKKLLQINIFDDYTIFGIKDNNKIEVSQE